jgi:hypothetical protein
MGLEPLFPLGSLLICAAWVMKFMKLVRFIRTR